MPDNGGFSVADREVLTTVKVQLGYLVSSVQDALVRIGKLEETRLTMRDLEELMADTDTLRQENKTLAKRVSRLEEWRYKIVGAAIAVGGIAGFLARLVK